VKPASTVLSAFSQNSAVFMPKKIPPAWKPRYYAEIICIIDNSRAAQIAVVPNI
jgi:hypothetical protein